MSDRSSSAETVIRPSTTSPGQAAAREGVSRARGVGRAGQVLQPHAAGTALHCGRDAARPSVGSNAGSHETTNTEPTLALGRHLAPRRPSSNPPGPGERSQGFESRTPYLPSSGPTRNGRDPYERHVLPGQSAERPPLVATPAVTPLHLDRRQCRDLDVERRMCGAGDWAG
jgi:hypothetical protein